jgi:hypothetical protein
LGDEGGGLGWVRVERAQRCLVLRPLISSSGNGHSLPEEQPPSPGSPPDPLAAGFTSAASPGGPLSHTHSDLEATLAAIGIQDPKRTALARHPIDPLHVRAWYLWATDSARRGLANPIGAVIRQLERGEPPPAAFLRRIAPPQPLPQIQEPEPPDPDLATARELWTLALDQLSLSMAPATFDQWLRGSRVHEAAPGHLTVRVRSPRALDWLQQRLMSLIRRTVEGCAGHPVEVTFIAEPAPSVGPLAHDGARSA